MQTQYGSTPTGSLTAWRLRDDRWLIWREIAGPGHAGGQRIFALGDALPR